MELLLNLTLADIITIVSAVGGLVGVGGGIFRILQKYKSMETKLVKLDEINKMMCKSLFAVLDAMTGGGRSAVLDAKEELRLHLIENH